MSRARGSLCGVDPFSIPLRVLHVSQPVDGGVANYVRSAAAYQARAGWSVTVAAPAALGDDPGVRYLAWQARRNPLVGIDAERRAIKRITREVGPDVVVLHSAKAGLSGRIAVRASIPTVFVPHAWSFYALPGPLAGAALAWELWARRWTNATVAVSVGEAEDGLRRGLRGPVFVVPNPVPEMDSDNRALTRAAARSTLPSQITDLAGPLVVCLGRICRQKGQDRLLAAWPDVLRLIPTAQLLLVGDGPDHAALRRSAPPGVHLIGATREPLRYLAAADLVVIPSRWEGMSLTMLEAMSLGRSVVTTDVAGSDVVRAAAAGAVVRGGDGGALALALAERLLAPGRAAAEGERGRAFVRAHHGRPETFTALSAAIIRAYAFGPA